MQQQHSLTLQAALDKKDKELHDCKALFEQLKKDFKYNLKLLQDRDRELEQNDLTIEQLRAETTGHMSTISELGVKHKATNDKLGLLMAEKELMETNYKQQLEKERANHMVIVKENHSRHNQELEALTYRCQSLEQQLKVS